MSKVRSSIRALVLTFAVTTAAVGLGALSTAPAGASGIYNVNHIVVFMQENRSADTYLGQLNAEGQPGYEAEPTSGNPNPLVSGGTITPFHKTSMCETADLNHSWNGEHQAYDNGAMDGFTAANDINSANADPTDLPVSAEPDVSKPVLPVDRNLFWPYPKRQPARRRLDADDDFRQTRSGRHQLEDLLPTDPIRIAVQLCAAAHGPCGADLAVLRRCGGRNPSRRVIH